VPMREFMLLILNRSDSKNSLSVEKHAEFVRKCEMYINKLKSDGKLISAQPLVREGTIISGSHGQWKEILFNDKDEVQVGYYHIVAQDINEAIALAKDNPEFEYTNTARIEVRPIKVKEDNTGFVYPSN
jgi:hypothetical protein